MLIKNFKFFFTDKQVNKKISLQMVVKAINNSAGLDKIISTLLVFGAYPQITKIDALSLSITKKKLK